MDARSDYQVSERPLVARVDGPQAGDDGNANSDSPNGDKGDTLNHLIGQFLRGNKERRKHLLQAAQAEATVKLEKGCEDHYEPQRLTRKIHWQYDSSMKKVPMLRRNYIG
jgi:hypothetical protein